MDPIGNIAWAVFINNIDDIPGRYDYQVLVNGNSVDTDWKMKDDNFHMSINRYRDDMGQENARRGADLLAADIESAFGLEVHIEDTIPERLRRQPSPPARWIELTVPALNIGVGSTLIATSTTGIACELAQHIHDDVLSRSGKIWPADPDGGDQPLLPTDDGWRGTGGLIPYGQVKVVKDPDQSLDGVVRWWLPNTYDGLIASRSGDVWFSFWEYKGDEQLITPGMPVTWIIGEGGHRKYRKASEVRPAQP